MTTVVVAAAESGGAFDVTVAVGAAGAGGMGGLEYRASPPALRKAVAGGHRAGVTVRRG